MSQIKISEEKGRRRYVARTDGGLEAELTYTWSEANRMSLDHVGVPKEIGGRGIGKALVAHAVAEARAKGFKLALRCPFAAAQFERHPEWADVIAEEGR